MTTPSTKSPSDATETNMSRVDRVENVNTFRRILPQLLGALAKNLIIINIGEFIGFSAITISSLTGLSKELNPDETVKITAAQASWLSTLPHVVHPIGGLLSGPINDKIGRRKAIMLVNIPLTIGWIVLGSSHSFPVICALFTLIGFSFGLKEAPSFTYVSEISEPSVRGMLMTINTISYSMGTFIAMALGSTLPWRSVAFICSLSPITCLIAILFVPESPSWLLSKDRPKDALKSLQWLRGWVSPLTVHKEFTELQNYSNTSNACVSCTKQAIRCYHPKPTFCDKIKELKLRRNILPIILMCCFYIFSNFSGSSVWDPYIIQVLRAFGTPINPNSATILISCVETVAAIALLLIVKSLGRRKIYLTSIMVLGLCSCGLSVYGFAFFPSRWISFKKDPNEAPKDLELIREMVGKYSYLALTLVLLMRFCAKIGVDVMPIIYVGEIFPMKSRSFLCGIAIGVNYILKSIATKTYYNIEMLLSLPGAILFYGIISLIGFFLMYSIVPDTEQRSLEDIELHYSDTTKRITDIEIKKHSKTREI